MARRDEQAVVIDGATKSFRIPSEQRNTLKERVLHPLRRTGVHDLDALRDVTFDVKAGEFFGIVGRNGSGKSTLLKCLAGIYQLDGGRIAVAGRISPFIELGVGFHQELAARDNILLNGVMLGLTPAEAASRVDRVIEFAELEDFTDLKLKNYSSGMNVRLAFAVMIQVDADVLLIDEILAVGDAAFQQKCFDVFYRLREEGKTIVLVTHDMAAVERFCHRAVLLEKGEVVTIGNPRDVADRYLDLNFKRELGDPEGSGSRRGGSGEGRVVEAWMEDEHGVRQATFPQGVQCVFKARVEFTEEVRDPVFSVTFVSPQLQNVFVVNSATEGEAAGLFGPGEGATFSVKFDNALAPGRYALSTVVARRGSGVATIDRWENLATIVVTGARPGGGIVDLPHELSIERTGVADPAGRAT
jgi:ABC-type polysaccharide/polyol phosphate transport system ATPase subunit